MPYVSFVCNYLTVTLFTDDSYDRRRLSSLLNVDMRGVIKANQIDMAVSNKSIIKFLNVFFFNCMLFHI